MKEIILNLSKKQKIILSIVISIIFVLVLIYVYQNLYEEDAEILLTNEENEVDSKVNINTASKEKLETLPGVGETTAQKIIDYREANGKFKTIEDIKNVSGIGDAKYESLKDKITV